jgi:hypothetical protein
VKSVTNVLLALDAVPALYTTLDESDHVLFEPMLICGIYRDAEWTVADPKSLLRLKVEEI